MDITTSPRACMATGNCVLTAPDYFAQDDEGTVRVLRASVERADEGDVQMAADMCPAAAILLS